MTNVKCYFPEPNRVTLFGQYNNVAVTLSEEHLMTSGEGGIELVIIRRDLDRKMVIPMFGDPYPFEVQDKDVVVVALGGKRWDDIDLLAYASKVAEKIKYIDFDGIGTVEPIVKEFDVSELFENGATEFAAFSVEGS